MQGDGFAIKLGGIMEVAMWFCALLLVGLWSSLGLVPNYVVLILGNEGGSPHHIKGRHTRSLYIGLRKLVVLTFNIPQILIEANEIFFLSLYLWLEQKLIWFYFLFFIYQPCSHMYVQ